MAAKKHDSKNLRRKKVDKATTGTGITINNAKN